MTGLYLAISFTLSRKLPCFLSQSIDDGHENKDFACLEKG